MQSFLKHYAAFVVRHAWMVLASSLVITGVVVSGMARLVVDLDNEKQLPADNPYVIIDRKIRTEFGGKNFVAIAVVPQSGSIWRQDVLQVIHDLTLDLLNAPGIIRQNVVSLSSPYVRVPKNQGGALAVDYLMRDVPQDEAGITALRELYQGEPLFRGTVVSEDGRAAMVLADFYDDVPDAQISAAVETAVAKYQSPDLRIAITGSPIFETSEAVVLRRQKLYFAATVVAILLVLYLAFGQLQGVIIPGATALLSTAWAMGFMGHVGIPMNAWTAAVPVMVLTVAAGHSTQMLKRYYEDLWRFGNREAAVIESTSRIGVVMMAAGATAGSGFAALSILGIPTLMYFGLGVACGIFAAVILEMTFMIALRALWPARRERRGGEGRLSNGLGLLLRPLEAGASRHPRYVVASFVVLALVAAAGYPRLTMDFIVRNYRSRTTPVGRDLGVFEKHFPSTTTLTILLEGNPGSMKSPEAIRLMRGLTRTMAADPDVGRASSLADILQRTYEVFAPEEAAGGLPDDARLISQLFFLADSPAFERFVNRPRSHAVVRGFLNREESASTRRVIDRLQQYLKKNPPRAIRVSVAGGFGPTILALNEHTVKGKILNIIIVLLVIIVVASLLLRTILGGAYVAAPIVMALIVNLGLFSWSRVAFDLVGASIAAINVGIGADYAIYFLYRLREEFHATRDFGQALHTTMETSGRAVLFVAVAMSAGFAVSIPSDFYGLRLMGLFIPATMIVSSLTALTLLPALVLLLRPGFIFRPAEPAAVGPDQSLTAAS
ncbi:MAG: RND family transporter [Candidatus Binatia bacterium]